MVSLANPRSEVVASWMGLVGGAISGTICGPICALIALNNPQQAGKSRLLQAAICVAMLLAGLVAMGLVVTRSE
jgi:hypothetical protein